MKKLQGWYYDSNGDIVEVEAPMTEGEIKALPSTGNLDATHGWTFKFNSFTGEWLASEDENAKEITNNYGSEHVLRSKSSKTLRQLIKKHEGLSAKEINKIYDK